MAPLDPRKPLHTPFTLGPGTGQKELRVEAQLHRLFGCQDVFVGIGEAQKGVHIGRLGFLDNGRHVLDAGRNALCHYNIDSPQRQFRNGHARIFYTVEIGYKYNRR
jgi:hypothetical protein